MKNLIAAAVLFVATSVFGIPNCITNIQVILTDPNASFNGGGSQTNVPLGGTVTINYNPTYCPTTNTTIGLVIIQCDTSRNCGGGPCPPNHAKTIEMYAGMGTEDLNVYTVFGCCSFTFSYGNMQPCQSFQCNTAPTNGLIAKVDQP